MSSTNARLFEMKIAFNPCQIRLIRSPIENLAIVEAGILSGCEQDWGAIVLAGDAIGR
jgi:hypothetical protein